MYMELSRRFQISPSHVRLHCSITSKRVMCIEVLVCSCSLDIRCAIHVRLIDLTEGSRPPSNALPSCLVYSLTKFASLTKERSRCASCLLRRISIILKQFHSQIMIDWVSVLLRNIEHAKFRLKHEMSGQSDVTVAISIGQIHCLNFALRPSGLATCVLDLCISIFIDNLLRTRALDFWISNFIILLSHVIKQHMLRKVISPTTLTLIWQRFLSQWSKYCTQCTPMCERVVLTFC